MKIKKEIIDFEKSMGPWLGKTMKMADYHMQEAFSEAGLDITKEQMIILKKLHDEDGLPQNELATLTYRDKSSLTRLLAKMEAKGYVSRIQSRRDKRINRVYLTEEGRTTFRNTRPVLKQILNVMEHGIDKEEKLAVIAVLKKIQVNFEAEQLQYN